LELCTTNNRGERREKGGKRRKSEVGWKRRNKNKTREKNRRDTYGFDGEGFP
jgi:hypothetical protein